MGGILQVDSIKNNNTSNLITQTNTTTITIGASGQTITIPSGATLTNNGTATGFGLTTQSVQTTGFTAVKGNLYPCNTTSSAFTVTLPASASVGDQIGIVDYAGTFGTNPIIINPNGLKLNGSTSSLVASNNREGLTLIFLDTTQGWVASSDANSTTSLQPITYSANILVVGGGGAGGGGVGGGGGAGGYRTSTQTLSGGTVYTITVGNGGAQVATTIAGNDGSSSSISGSGLTTITSAGGYTYHTFTSSGTYTA